MLFAVIAFCCVFLMLASAGVMLFHRQALLERIHAVVMPQKEKASLTTTLQQTSTSLSAAVGKLEQVIPKSQAEVSVAQQRLIRAGFREDSAVQFFYGSKALAILLLMALVMFTGLGKQNLFAYVGAAAAGYLGPDFWLGKKIKKRQAQMRRGLPDVLDLLVICVEAGLGLDQATARTVQELAKTHPVLADELDIVVLEQRAGRARSEAWKNMSDRTDVDVVRNLVSILVQAEQFGTSVAKTLRTHSDTLRTQRVQMIEEMAAKTTVKLLFPLIIFIFPCLFLVTLGPALILMSQSFANFFH